MAEIEMLVKGYQCERCDHKWIPHKKSKLPTICPKCKSPYWNVKRKRDVV